MTGPRLILLLGVAAGLSSNYWVLEPWLADRSDPAAAWISELGARSETSGWAFSLLDLLSGALILGFALAIRPLLDGRSTPLRLGAWGLAGVGACTIVDGAAPLSCAESLTSSCELSYDAIDLVHGAETFASVLITVVTFVLFAVGFSREADRSSRRLGVVTTIVGATWILLNLLMFSQYAIGDLEALQGAFHRAAQVVLGAWLIALAVGLRDLDPKGREAVPRAWQDRR